MSPKTLRCKVNRETHDKDGYPNGRTPWWFAEVIQQWKADNATLHASQSRFVSRTGHEPPRIALDIERGGHGLPGPTRGVGFLLYRRPVRFFVEGNVERHDRAAIGLCEESETVRASIAPVALCWPPVGLHLQVCEGARPFTAH